MAQITYRVAGTIDGDKKRVSQKFRNDQEGRTAAAAFEKTLADSKRVYDVRTRIGGRVVTRTFKTRALADAFAATTAADKLRGIAIDPRHSQVVFKVYSQRWLAQRADLAERTRELYQWLLRSYIGPSFDNVPLAELSPSLVRSWNMEIAREHPTTAAKAYRLLNTIMRTAVADEIITRNPCQIKGASVEKAPERPVASIAEVQALADAMPDHLRIAVLLAAWCQLRRGELLGLRRRDIDLLRGTVSISLTRGKGMNGKEIIKAPKTDAGRRTVAIPSNILPAIISHLEQYVNAGVDSPLLIGEKGAPVIPGVLGTAWDRARKQIGRPELRLHDLRHSGLTWSAATGASIAELMRRAGHSSPAAALRYQHATEDRDQVLAAALANMSTNAPITFLNRAIDAR